MTSIFLGKIDVTAAVAQAKGVTLDGTMSPGELKKYLPIINQLAKAGVISKDQQQMFTTFLLNVNKEGCAGHKDQLLLVAELRDVIVSYLEGNEKMQGNPILTAFATDLTIMLNNYHVKPAPGKLEQRGSYETGGQLPIDEEAMNEARAIFQQTDYSGPVCSTSLGFSSEEVEQKPTTPSLSLSPSSTNPIGSGKYYVISEGIRFSSDIIQLDPRKR